MFSSEESISRTMLKTATLNDQYCYVSGQAINLNKSGIYFSKGCPQLLRKKYVQGVKDTWN